MARKLSRIIFFTGLFLLPLIHFPLQINGFEGPKEVFFERWAEILLMSGVLCLVSSKDKQKSSKLTYLLLGYFFWNLLTSFWGSDFHTSFYGLFWRGQGLLMLAHLVGLAILIPTFLSRDDLGKIGKTLALSAGVASVYLIWTVVAKQAFDFPVYLYLGRAVGSFGNLNFAAGFFAICLPFCFLFKNKLIKILLSVTLVVGITLTASRGGALALLLGAVFLGMIRLWKRNKYFVVGGAMVIIVGSVLFLAKWYPVPVTSNTWASSRQRIWGRAIIAVWQQPIFGYGLENYELAVKSVDYPFKLDQTGEVQVDKAHSEILDVLVASGVPGLILWLLIFLYAARRFYLQKNYLFLAALMIFFVKAQTNVVSISEYALFWILVGLSVVDN